MRLHAVLPVLAFALIGSSGAPAAAARAPNRTPNIIVVMVDDQPALDGRLLDSEPNVHDIFVEHGVTFTNFHSESPLCCPARAGFFTGEHTHNHGVTLNEASLLDPSMTIATQLHGDGYSTFLSGKYLNQYGRVAERGGGMPPGWDHFFAVGDPEYYDYDVYSDGDPDPIHYGHDASDYSPDVFGKRFVDQIRQAPRDQPIFGWYAPMSPHAPVLAAPRYDDADCHVRAWDPPSYDEADVSDKPRYVRSAPSFGGGKANGFSLNDDCRSLLAVDEWVGKIRDVLAQEGRLDNTIFIYAGDNGMNTGEHRLLDKQAPYNTDIPFLVSWPDGVGSEPRTIDERVQNIDLAPTLCELAGCTLGPYPNGQRDPDGISFADLLLGRRNHLQRDAVLDEMPQVKAVGPSTPPPPPWYAVTTTGSSPLATVGCAAALTGGCRWHYVEYDDGESELYDVSNGPCYAWQAWDPGDPCELQNLAGRPGYQSLARVLHGRLAELEREHGYAPALVSARLLAACDEGLAFLEHDGATWLPAGRRLEGRRLNALARAGDTLVAGGRAGTLVSSDAGETWHDRSDGLAVRYVRFLHGADGCVLAGTEPADVFHAPAGETWVEATGVSGERDRLGWFLPYSPEAGCVRGFAVHGERVYAAVEVGGILRSDDGGRSFRLCGGSDGHPHLGPSRPDVLYPDVHSVAAHPSSPDRLAAATAGGIYVSEDGGESFERRSPAWYTRALHVDPEDFDHLVVGAAHRVSDKQGRIVRTRDGGRTYAEEPGAEGPWPATIVERFAATPAGLFAIRDDGVVLVLGGDGRWAELALDLHVRMVCVTP